MRCRTIERGRSSETESETKREGKRGLGFWRHSSLCINITGNHHVPSSLPPPLYPPPHPWEYKLYYFFPCPLHAFYHPSRARTKRRDSSLSQLVMRFSVLSLPPRVTTFMHARVVLYFSRESGMSETFYHTVRILQSKLCCRRSRNVHVISSDVRH